MSDMTFPNTPLPIGVELYYDSIWNDITPDVAEDAGLQIHRGRSSESQQAEPVRMNLSLYNGDGKYSPRNPNSPLYGKIGRNTPIRAWVENGDVRFNAARDEYFSTADSAATSITGDIDLRVCASRKSWRTGNFEVLGIYKPGSYYLQVTDEGHLRIVWSTDGANSLYLTSSEPIPGSRSGRKTLRVTLDVNNGAGGKTARFYWSNDSNLSMSGTGWTEFGTANVEAGTTSIYNSANGLRIYNESNWPTEFYSAQVRNGIAGTIVAYPIFTAQSNGSWLFADGYSNTWSAATTETVNNRHYRFSGEVVEWPQRWGLKGAPQARAEIECAGSMRRLMQGGTVAQSALRRGISGIGSMLVAYWPMEDAVGTDVVRPVVGIKPIRVIGSPEFGKNDLMNASAPLCSMNTAYMSCDVDSYTNTNEFQVRFILNCQSVPNGTVLARVYTNNTLGWMDLTYTTASGGTLTLTAFTNLGDATAVSLVNTNTGGVDGKTLRVDIEAVKNGSGIDFALWTLQVGASTGYGSTGTGNVASATLGACSRIVLNPNRASLGSTSIGHLTVEKDITSIFDISSQMSAYDGETAIVRFDRLCWENGISYSIVGYGEDSSQMGEQGIDDIVSLLRQCAETDGGILHEQRYRNRLEFRTLSSMTAQAPWVTIQYTDNLILPFEPVDDDSATRNRVTVTRTDGASATVEDETSPMGTAAPPVGVGVYEQSLDVSLYRDDQTIQQAAWRVHVGTVNEARWPQMGFDFAHPTLVADSATTTLLLTLDVGDRIDVEDLPSWLPPFDVRALVQGYTEDITPFSHKVVFNCSPYSPYDVGYYNDTNARFDSNGSTLTSTTNSTTTSVSVTISDGTLWTTSSGDMPFDIVVDGEIMTVSNVSGSSSPQTFTVTRSVNGVVKSHSAGAVVKLAEPYYIGL